MSPAEIQNAVKLSIEVLSMHSAGVITKEQAKAMLAALNIGVTL